VSRLQCDAVQRRRRFIICREVGLDIAFILLIAGLYAVSHWIAWAISRLGGEP
jgi:hypothetical protein